MRTIVFEPHADDAILFCSYSILENPGAYVITVLGADGNRAKESRAAVNSLGVGARHDAWCIPELSPDWGEVEARMRVLSYDIPDAIVFAPAIEEGGHDHHSAVGKLTFEVFGEERCRFYLTYQRGHGRSRSDTEVVPREGWMAKKFQALACYPSQIERADTRPWFCSDDALREWLL